MNRLATTARARISTYIATVTIAVKCEVNFRSDFKVAASPCPPPKATTFGAINVLFPSRGESHAQKLSGRHRWSNH